MGYDDLTVGAICVSIYILNEHIPSSIWLLALLNIYCRDTSANFSRPET